MREDLFAFPLSLPEAPAVSLRLSLHKPAIRGRLQPRRPGGALRGIARADRNLPEAPAVEYLLPKIQTQTQTQTQTPRGKGPMGPLGLNLRVSLPQPAIRGRLQPRRIAGADRNLEYLLPKIQTQIQNSNSNGKTKRSCGYILASRTMDQTMVTMRRRA